MVRYIITLVHPESGQEMVITFGNDGRPMHRLDEAQSIAENWSAHFGVNVAVHERKYEIVSDKVVWMAFQ